MEIPTLMFAFDGFCKQDLDGWNQGIMNASWCLEVGVLKRNGIYM